MDIAELQDYYDKKVRKRIIKAPFMNVIRLVRLCMFQFTEDHRCLKKLRGKYEGQCCFIVGNGPSLTIEDLEKIKCEHCFGFNRIYETFDKTAWRPEFYMVLDNDVMRNVAKNLEKVEAKIKLLNIMAKARGVKRDDNTIFFCSFGLYRVKEYAYKKKRISTDISRYFSLNFSVACVAIEAAIYMGFKKIVLIGFDNNFSRYVDENGKIHTQDIADYSLMSMPDYIQYSLVDASNSCFAAYRTYAESNGIEILNATRGGKLEAFERVNFDELMTKTNLEEN